jgi:CubicO group peptidase (beta-lactamase class C family)
MTLFDRGKFHLDDRVKKFLPAFTGGGRDAVRVRHMLTHVSGQPISWPTTTSCSLHGGEAATGASASGGLHGEGTAQAGGG